MLIEPWPVDKPIPATLTDRQLMSIMQVRKSSFYAAKAHGKFQRFALTDPVGDAKWSGPKVSAWLNQEHAPVTRHFGKAQKPRGRRAEAA